MLLSFHRGMTAQALTNYVGAWRLNDFCLAHFKWLKIMYKLHVLNLFWACHRFKITTKRSEVDGSPNMPAPTVLAFEKFLQIGAVDVIPYLFIDSRWVYYPVDRYSYTLFTQMHCMRWRTWSLSGPIVVWCQCIYVNIQLCSLRELVVFYSPILVSFNPSRV